MESTDLSGSHNPEVVWKELPITMLIQSYEDTMSKIMTSLGQILAVGKNKLSENARLIGNARRTIEIGYEEMSEFIEYCKKNVYQNKPISKELRCKISTISRILEVCASHDLELAANFDLNAAFELASKSNKVEETRPTEVENIPKEEHYLAKSQFSFYFMCHNPIETPSDEWFCKYKQLAETSIVLRFGLSKTDAPLIVSSNSNVIDVLEKHVNREFFKLGSPYLVADSEKEPEHRIMLGRPNSKIGRCSKVPNGIYLVRWMELVCA